MTNQLLHGVVQDGKLVYSLLHSSGRRQLVTASVNTTSVPSILQAAIEHNLHTVWVTPGDVLNYWTPERAQDSTDTWDIKITTARNPVRGLPDFIRGVSGRRKIGNYQDKRQVTICYPQWNTYQWNINEIPEAADPIACLAAIHYLETAIGIPLHHNPGITGRNLIAETNSTNSRPSWVVAPTADLSNLGDLSVGYDFAYQRGIDPTDMSGRPMYLHAWDKNSMYLGAGSSVELGTGNPVYINTHGIEEALKQWYDGKRPGYWRVDLHEKPALNPLYEGQEWVTTPLLKLLYAMGAKFTVREAWVWSEHHRILDKFATILWDARQGLKEDTAKYKHEGGRKLAYYSIKRIATAGPGMLANKDAQKYAPQWYRPDWRSTLVEDAKARLIYKLLQVEREYGVRPLCVATDCVFYLSEQPNPSLAFPHMFDRDGLGGWKLAYSMPATYGVLSCFKPGISAARAVRDVKKFVKEGE